MVVLFIFIGFVVITVARYFIKRLMENLEAKERQRKRDIEWFDANYEMYTDQLEMGNTKAADRILKAMEDSPCKPKNINIKKIK